MKVKVHLIPTDGNSHLTMRETDSLLIHHINKINNREFEHLRAMHLYFTIDEKPSDGDFYICPENLLRRCKTSFQIGGRKVIASTSEFLGVHLIPTLFQTYYCQGPVESVILQYNPNDITEEIKIDYLSTEASLSISSGISDDEPIEFTQNSQPEEPTYTSTDLIGNGEGSLDDFLLNSPDYTQEERELVMDVISSWIEKNN